MATRITLGEDDRARIATAVTAAEAHTSGEIVTILADHSDEYADIALIWSVLIALLALAALAFAPAFYLGLVDRVLGRWDTSWTPREVLTLAALVAAAKFTGMWLLQLWRPLRLALVPGAIKHRRVRARAVTCYRVGTEKRTTGATGIVLYLSRAERRAEIVADGAIAAKVAPEVWGAAMAAMVGHIRDGRVAQGMAEAIAQVGVVLAEHFPRSPDDINELPDRLIEV
jgi:putative membrane protein